jgi:phosphohistidine phosphatase
MRILYLLRHAKASSNNASWSDFDRPLVERGRKVAEQMGLFLASKKGTVSTLIVSPALRTRQTIEIFGQHAGLNVEPRFDGRIYDASLEKLVQVVSEIDDEKQSAMLVGHNPGMEDMLAFVTRESRHMPSGALAKIDLDCASWQEVGRGTGRLDWLIMPRSSHQD